MQRTFHLLSIGLPEAIYLFILLSTIYFTYFVIKGLLVFVREMKK